jgi:ABC-2 type transport system ATP-binding protein
MSDDMTTQSLTGNYAIVTQSLSKRFRRKWALDGVSARVPVGSIYGLMGPNGAGKTTFVRCLLNLLNPTSGSGTVLGHDIVRDSVAVRRRVGHVAALQPLWDWMTVRELADFMAGCYPKWDQEAVKAVLSPVGIELNDKIQDLSRGQRTLAALAVAIGHQPDLLLLDEALTGLDPISRREVLRNVIDVMHAENRTVLITGQDIADMERICDYVGFLIKGKLFWESTLEDLKASVKRLRIEHLDTSPPEIPANALNLARAARETQFTTADFTQELLASLAAPGRRVEVMDLSLEDIFIDLASASGGLNAAGPSANAPMKVSA